MVKFRYTFMAKLGHFNDARLWAVEMNAQAKRLGMVESKLWAIMHGPMNMMVLESEYPDLAALERDDNTGNADAGYMKALRDGIQWVADGTVPTVEILQEAPILA